MAVNRPEVLHSLVGYLELEAPLHIGSGRGDLRTDSLILLDRRGVPYVPGSSLTGLLREVTRELAAAVGCAELTEDLWGSGTEEAEKTLSAVEVSDALLREDEDYARARAGALEVREHVGLRRDREVAREQIKFDREVAPRGLRFWFELQIGDPTETEQAMLNELFSLLSRRGGSLGGRVGTGLGEFALHLCSSTRTNMKNPDQLLAFLLSSDDPRLVTPAGAEIPQPFTGVTALAPSSGAEVRELNWCRIDLRLDVVPGWPLMVKSEVQHNDCVRQAPGEAAKLEAVDTNFVRTLLAPGSWEVTLPGSGLRGALRARAEKILRTVVGSDSAACDPTCHRKLVDGEGHPVDPPLLSCAEAKPDASRDQLCPACQVFGSSTFGGHLRVGEGLKVEGSFTDADEKLLDHVAIDRFTGGPVGQKKFTSRPLLRGSFTTSITLQGFELWELGLIAYLLKDLHDADLRIGYGKYKGFSKVRGVVTGFRLETVRDSGWVSYLEELELTPNGHSTSLIGEFAPLPQDAGRPSPEGPAFLEQPDGPLGRLLTCCAHQCDGKLDARTEVEVTHS